MSLLHLGPLESVPLWAWLPLCEEPCEGRAIDEELPLPKLEGPVDQYVGNQKEGPSDLRCAKRRAGVPGKDEEDLPQLPLKHREVRSKCARFDGVCSSGF